MEAKGFLRWSPPEPTYLCSLILLSRKIFTFRFYSNSREKKFYLLILQIFTCLALKIGLLKQFEMVKGADTKVERFSDKAGLWHSTEKKHQIAI